MLRLRRVVLSPWHVIVHLCPSHDLQSLIQELIATEFTCFIITICCHMFVLFWCLMPYFWQIWPVHWTSIQQVFISDSVITHPIWVFLLRTFYMNIFCLQINRWKIFEISQYTGDMRHYPYMLAVVKFLKHFLLLEFAYCIYNLYSHVMY